VSVWEAQIHPLAPLKEGREKKLEPHGRLPIVVQITHYSPDVLFAHRLPLLVAPPVSKARQQQHNGQRGQQTVMAVGYSASPPAVGVLALKQSRQHVRVGRAPVFLDKIGGPAGIVIRRLRQQAQVRSQ
jgi:hypothetical protein